MSIYFNQNSTSYPKPPEVLAAVQTHLNSPPQDAHRGGKGADTLQLGRKSVAKFFNAAPHQVVFTSGATEALNLAILGLAEHRHIITTATEHNSVLRPLMHLQRDKNMQLDIAPCDTFGFVNPNDIQARISRHTDAIIINHCSNVTGAIQDLAAVASIANQYNIPLIVDASQSAGLLDIDFAGLNIAALAFTGHKSLFATTGIGGLILSDNLALRPLKTGGTGSQSDYLYQPTTRPTHYEAGTANMLGVAALTAGIDYINRVGMAHILALKRAHYQYVVDALKDVQTIKWHGGREQSRQLPVINWSVEGFSVAELAYILSESYNITVRDGLHCAPLLHQQIGTAAEGTVRVSFSHLQTEEELVYLVNAMQEIASAAQ